MCKRPPPAFREPNAASISQAANERLAFDDFFDHRKPGKVVGSPATSGQLRRGVDVEGVISIDNGELRIAPLVEPGFGRASLVYGPFEARPGLAFATYLLNGHNTAQAEPLPERLGLRLIRWLTGSGTEPRPKRFARWLVSGRVRRVLRQVRGWHRARRGGRPFPRLDENLAVGWFPSSGATDPRAEGSPFVMHALGPENGELWAGTAGRRTRVLRGVQNLPLYLVAVLREGGTVYYAASLEGAPALAAHPWLAPLAVDARTGAASVCAGIHQSVLGQIGWRIDTRVRGVRIATVPGYDVWWGGAHAADRTPCRAGEAHPHGEAGGSWQVQPAAGSGDCGPPTVVAILDPGKPSGLVHAIVSPGSHGRNETGLIWRYLDGSNHWKVMIGDRVCEILAVSGGIPEVVLSRTLEAASRQERRLQVIDDGRRVMAYVDGEPLAEAWIVDSRHADATGAGIQCAAGEAGRDPVRRFEAHPRGIRLPALLDMGAPWTRTGSRVVIQEDFSGPPSDLAGRKTPVGGARWTRLIGNGLIELTGDGAARVRASAEEPCPGRTAYCVDWPHEDFADLEVTLTPPGVGPGRKHMTTSGFLLYQDARNYLILNAWRADNYGGGSISTFFTFRGFEDLYDAVWTNVGDRVSYGKPVRLRLCCDGKQYLAWLDGEPVLYRALSDVYPNFWRLAIRKVGIVANWEFGTDTGSRFEQLVIRAEP